MAEGVEVGRAYVTVLPNATGFVTGMQSQIVPGMTPAGAAAGKSLGAGLLGSVKAIAGPLLGLFAAVKIVDFFREANDEARESQKVNALTASIIKSTGGAAKVTGEQVGGLAQNISNLTGIDDEAVQSGANMLLTFKKVRNEVGEGNNVFDRATQAAVNLSAAGFGSITGSSKMVGKALNDPIKGMAAMGRAGVTFTQEQKDMVKAMVESGDTLGAQKLILAEVESQVGGAAEASATASEKLTTKWNNFKEQIGTALLPVIDAAMNGIGQLVDLLSVGFDQASATMGPIFEKIIGFVKGFFESLNNVGSGDNPVSRLVGSFTTLGGIVQTNVMPILSQLGAWFMNTLIPAVAGVVSTVMNFYSTVAPIVVAFITGLMERLAPLAPTVMTIFSTIGSIITTTMALVQTVIQTVLGVIVNIWNSYGSQIMDVVSAVWTGIINVIEPIMRVIQNVIALVMNVIKGNWSGAWENIKGTLQGAWDAIKAAVTGAINIVKSVMSLAWAVIKGGVTSAWNNITTTIGNVVRGIVDKVSKGVGDIVDWFKGLPGKVVAALSGFVSRMTQFGKDVISGMINGIKDMASRLISSIVNTVKNAVDGAKRFLGIASPSKLARVLLGRNLVRGAIAGVDDMLPAAQKVGEALADAMVSSPRVTPQGNVLGAQQTISGVSGVYQPTASGASITYGNVTVELSMDELAQFQTLVDFLETIDRKVQQGVGV